MIICFQNILLLKEFLACNGCFGLLTKIKNGSGTSFWCTFSVRFFHENVPFLISYQWTKFQCHTFFLSQDFKQNVLRSSYLDSWWHHNFNIYLGSSSKAMAAGRKSGEDGNTKNWISCERKELFRWNKKYLSKFLKGYHLVKNKSLLKK